MRIDMLVEEEGDKHKMILEKEDVFKRGFESLRSSSWFSKLIGEFLFLNNVFRREFYATNMFL